MCFKKSTVFQIGHLNLGFNEKAGRVSCLLMATASISQYLLYPPRQIPGTLFSIKWQADWTKVNTCWKPTHLRPSQWSCHSRSYHRPGFPLRVSTRNYQEKGKNSRRTTRWSLSLFVLQVCHINWKIYSNTIFFKAKRVSIKHSMNDSIHLHCLQQSECKISLGRIIKHVWPTTTQKCSNSGSSHIT